MEKIILVPWNEIWISKGVAMCLMRKYSRQDIECWEENLKQKEFERRLKKSKRRR